MFFAVGEIGVNWDGDEVIASEIMKNAKNAGCDAVKFQSFTEDMVKNHPESERLVKSSISPDNIELIDKLAKSLDLEWFCTPMYPKAVDFLEPFVNRFKLREFDGRSLLDNSTTELFERIKKTGKEIIVSSEKSPKKCQFYNDPQIKWLYCVPKYPCELNEINFKELSDFDGYSNHCPDIIVPLTSAILGAKIIEVHITPDKSKSFVDNPVSFDYQELKSLVDNLRKIEKINF
jgi:sialic acid synthase SpsE